MVYFDLSSFSILFFCIDIVRALPHHPQQHHKEAYRRRTVNGLVLEAYQPRSIFETYGSGIEHTLSRRAGVTLAESAIAFIQSRLDFVANSTEAHAAYEGSTASYAYLTQHHRGIPITNAVANVAFDKQHRVLAFGSSFVRHDRAASVIPSVSVEDAISSAERALRGNHEGGLSKPTLEYFAKADGSLALTHVVQVRNASEGTWYEAFVDAHSGELLSITNFVTQATYRVLPITKQDLTQGFEDLVDPQDSLASPLGWQNDGTTIYNTTTGNNALSFNLIQADVSVQSGPNLTFAFTQDPMQDPSVQSNLDAARVNAFYVANMMHDISYRYGFTETAFNFQKNNFGLGGKGNDYIAINVQAAGFNNALFTAQRDGINGILSLYIWEDTSPSRDGALENDIIVHEYTHGITNRLTGGGTARCLQTLESGGLGEGWSDAMAEWTEHTSAEIKDYVLAAYVTNNPAGIRHHPYSTNTTTNPLLYSSLATLDEVHDMGEVWANMLHNVYAALVARYGFSQTAFTNPSGSEGNIVWLHLFIDALSIQPCNPTFVNARDAWIQADATRYGGANKCLLWITFASKGLGLKAANFTDDFTVPPGC